MNIEKLSEFLIPFVFGFIGAYIGFIIKNIQFNYELNRKVMHWVDLRVLSYFEKLEESICKKSGVEKNEK